MIAGEVHTVRPIVVMYASMEMDKALDATAAAPAPVSEKTFGDYHMYTLERPVDINESSTKQIEFIPTIKSIKVTRICKVLTTTGGQS